MKGTKNTQSILLPFESARSFKPLIQLLQGWTAKYRLELWLSTTSDHEADQFFSQLSARVNQMILDPSCRLGKEDYALLLPYGTFLGHIFYLGSHSVCEALQTLRDRSVLDEAEQFQFRDRSDAYKYFLFATAQCDQSVRDLIRICEIRGQSAYVPFVNALVTRITTDPNILQNRQHLIDNLELLNETVPSRQALYNVHMLWAISSFEKSENNYKIKQFLNELLNRRVVSEDLSLAPKVRQLRFSDLLQAGKPKLLVIAEVLHHEHVMYRCFGAALHELQSVFHVTVLTSEEDLGKQSWTWCDDLRTFPRGKFALNIEIDRIMQLNPDVIVYPSIGMRLWTLLLSRIRLAPLQICMMGHPDSPHAKEIDFALIGSALVDEDVDFPGNLIRMRSPGSLFDFSHDPQIPKVNPDKDSPSIHIAVCANVFKLSRDFIETCHTISERANRPIVFHFMQNMTGINYRVGKKQIESNLPHAEVRVYPALQKPGYFKVLAGCHFYLSPFPFGGENSTMDALLNGLPVVTLKGDLPLTRLDYRVLRELELPEWLICADQQAYITAAIRLIEMDKIRDEVRGQIKSFDIHAHFSGQTAHYKHELTDIIGELYDQKYGDN